LRNGLIVAQDEGRALDCCEYGNVSVSMGGEECVSLWLGSIKFSVPVSYVTGLSVRFGFQDRLMTHNTVTC
jgi:hypothetical protein